MANTPQTTPDIQLKTTMSAKQTKALKRYQTQVIALKELPLIEFVKAYKVARADFKVAEVNVHDAFSDIYHSIKIYVDSESGEEVVALTFALNEMYATAKRCKKAYNKAAISLAAFFEIYPDWCKLADNLTGIEVNGDVTYSLIKCAFNDFEDDIPF